MSNPQALMAQLEIIPPDSKLQLGWKDRTSNKETQTERRQRRHDAEDWDYYTHQATLIQQAIQLYDTIEATRESRASTN